MANSQSPALGFGDCCPLCPPWLLQNLAHRCLLPTAFGMNGSPVLRTESDRDWLCFPTQTSWKLPAFSSLVQSMQPGIVSALSCFVMSHTSLSRRRLGFLQSYGFHPDTYVCVCPGAQQSIDRLCLTRVQNIFFMGWRDGARHMMMTAQSPRTCVGCSAHWCVPVIPELKK